MRPRTLPTAILEPSALGPGRILSRNRTHPVIKSNASWGNRPSVREIPSRRTRAEARSGQSSFVAIYQLERLCVCGPDEKGTSAAFIKPRVIIGRPRRCSVMFRLRRTKSSKARRRNRRNDLQSSLRRTLAVDSNTKICLSGTKGRTFYVHLDASETLLRRQALDRV